MEDRHIEQERYNNFSASLLNNIEKESEWLLELGADNSPLYFQPPYLYYHNLINQNTSQSKKQLDLCCGNGVHSFTGAKNGAKVIALDYAEQSISVCRKRAEILKLSVDFRAADVQTLKDFKDDEFDIVTCAGSLSYLDNIILFEEVYRVLKNGGMFICVDSFNHNPIYRMNRFIHFLRGERSFGTLKRMPNVNTIKLLNKIFTNVDVNYFGIFTFIAPVLKLIMSPEKITRIINKLDILLPWLKRYSFKIVISASK
jgi:ubiquinone/menaquinone biosynthesis C-methylase UbiE